MRQTKLKAVVVSAGLVIMMCSSAYADTLIVNANGYTIDRTSKLIQFDAMVFNDQGKVVVTGDGKKLRKKYASAKLIDLQGKTVLPGLIDAHGHVFELGIAASQLSLRASANLEQAQKAIAEYAQKYPQHQWILGGEWNQAIWKLGRFPNAAEIDAVLKDRPVWLRRVDGHAGWANSAAMKLAGISRDTPDPQGGKIERDANGNATGIFVDSAMSLVEKVLPAKNESEMRAALDAAMAQLRSVGLTSVHDAGVSKEDDHLFREYAKQEKLTTRVYGMISGVQGFFDEVAKSGPLNSFAEDKYALRAVKLYSDGALGSRGAALLAPYSDAPHTKGLLFVSNQEMQTMVDKAASRGYQVNVHAIGDAGNLQVINSLAALKGKNSATVLRHRIEHAQVLQLSDIPRLKMSHIIPSMQPTHATSDMNMAEDRVGKQRLEGAYAWRTFLKQGSRIACGSDFPIESPNPFWGIYSAVSRQDFDQKPEGGWHAEQAMTRLEAFRCFTLDAAYAANQENILGSLEKGKWADFIVLDQDIFKVPVKQIYQTQVLQTWQAGKQVYAK
ncbi:amidohydrolase family protein [Undibacterium sp. LX40W]|uniref:Amidohydrolase family protein n=1 Tax=Undibacterium nitidum TaxID=2762298 RepID=A0A923HX95_9BURK|nr:MULTISPECIES: amidohydrolase [Undibacterium]MBC3883089.1 amidohydrolase family protein [Undibacterium nitidum]MBC3893370.1 amidohydrolase family protein [Undibacterium sp. LX40W]